jgi:serine/threonine protein kinase
MAQEGDRATDPFGLVGTILQPRYRVERAVAEGGFGVVYAAHHLTLDVPIAIKVLKPGPAHEPEAWADALDQFLVEARTMAKLRHPAIAVVYDTGIAAVTGYAQGVPWIALEWLDGETLRHDLEKRRGRGGRTPRECMALLRPVLEAVAHAHEAGIAHRDLKPSNVILVPEKGRISPRVVDFGIAKLMERETADASGHTATEGSVRAFSAAYAAPEQLAGTRTGPWTDVHALGLMLTELATDQPPYPDGAAERFAAVFSKERPTPATKNVDVGGWEPVLQRALAVAPAERFADAGELLAALDAAIPEAAERVSLAAARPPEASSRDPKAPGDSSTDRSVAFDARPEGVTTRPAGTRRSRARSLALAAGLAALGLGLGARYLRSGVTLGALDAAPSASSALPPACVSNTACTAANGGRPSICRHDKGCVTLASEDCSVLADARALEEDDTVWIGTMFPKVGADYLEFGRPNHQAAELARRDFAQTMSGLNEQNRARQFGIVACDDGTDALRAATHLVDEVGVPAVIGFRSSVEAIELSNSLFVPRRVVAMVANNANPLVTTVPQPPDGPRMVWRTTANNNDVAHALSAFTEAVLEPRIRSGAVALKATEAVRVALLRPKNTAGAAFSDAVFRSVRFNGKSALANGYDFRELTYDDTNAEKDAAAMLGELLRFVPHVVLYAGGAAIVRDVFGPLEERWPTGARVRPRYASVAMLTAEALTFLGTNADRRHRFFGVTPVSMTEANARFVMHYSETFDDKVTRSYAPNTIYDAFYLLAYATFTVAPGQPVTGPALARGFERLVPPGRRVEVGLPGIFEVFRTLRDGQRVDLTGATGDLDFDLGTGEAPFDYSILCAQVDAAGKAHDGVDSGLVYRAATGKLEGAMTCP